MKRIDIGVPSLAVALLFLPSLAPAGPETGPTFGDRSSGLGLGRDYNPAIGANLLMGGAFLSKEPGSTGLPEPVVGHLGETGLLFQEAEIALAAAVDPFFRADLITAFHVEDGHFHAEVEEGYVTTLGLRAVTIKVGKFLLPFGKHNTLHSHVFPFIDAPLPSSVLFGDEGLNEMAVSAAVLLPLPWFVEVVGAASNGDNEVLFASKKGRDLAYSGRLHTLVDLSDETTLELGGSCISGKNVAGGWTHAFGGDLTLKWRPAGRELYHQIVWQTEYFLVRRAGTLPVAPTGTDPDPVMAAQAGVPSGLGGGYTYLSGQIARQFWISARFDALGYPRGDGGPRLHRVSGLLAFVPTEFSALRLQYGFLKEELIHQVLLQLNVAIGAHPAHAY